MHHILEISDYFVNLEIDDLTKGRIREWVRKYEKYSNLYNNGDASGSIESVVNDVMSRFGIHQDKKDAVRDYLTQLYDISDGISVVMSPYPELIYVNNPDQVQKFYY